MRTFVLLLVAAAVLSGQNKEPVYPNGAKTLGPYSPGILAGDTLYVAGQVGRDAKGEIPKDFDAEVRQCLDNVGTILRQAGMSFEHAVAVQVYMTDMDLFDRMNAVYTTYFPDPRPARTTVGVARLVGPARIEITVTARKERPASFRPASGGSRRDAR